MQSRRLITNSKVILMICMLPLHLDLLSNSISSFFWNFSIAQTVLLKSNLFTRWNIQDVWLAFRCTNVFIAKLTAPRALNIDNAHKRSWYNSSFWAIRNKHEQEQQQEIGTHRCTNYKPIHQRRLLVGVPLWKCTAHLHRNMFRGHSYLVPELHIAAL